MTNQELKQKEMIQNHEKSIEILKNRVDLISEGNIIESKNMNSIIEILEVAKLDIDFLQTEIRELKKDKELYFNISVANAILTLLLFIGLVLTVCAL